MTKMFEANKSYGVYLLSGAVRTFVCTSVDGMIVRGSYNGQKEKSYKASPRWSCVADKQDGMPPSTYAIEINKSVGVDCISEDQI